MKRDIFIFYTFIHQNHSKNVKNVISNNSGLPARSQRQAFLSCAYTHTLTQKLIIIYTHTNS